MSVDLFETYEAQILAGRNFRQAISAPPTVVVNRSFAQMYLQDGNPWSSVSLPQRAEADTQRRRPWYQIIGVVRDFPLPART